MEVARRVFFKSEETVKKTKIGWIELDMTFMKLYHNAFKYVTLLNGVCSRDFYLWVLSKVDENNVFTFSRDLYREFAADLAAIPGARIYEENTVHLALREFLEKGLAWKISRGVYQLNPVVFDLTDNDSSLTTGKQLNQYQQTGVEIEIPDGEDVIEQEEDDSTDLSKPSFSGDLFSFDSFVD